MRKVVQGCNRCEERKERRRKEKKRTCSKGDVDLSIHSDTDAHYVLLDDK